MKSSFDKYVYRYLLTVALATLSIGTITYHALEHLSWVDAYYFSVITLTTIGYGDIVPHTSAGKIFTTFYVMVGIGIITAFISYTMRRQGEKLANRHKKGK
jgi:voltage-gated potassium channel